MPRLLGLATLVAFGIVVFASEAQGHALLRSSDPAAGALLDAAPSEVRLTFTEPPDRDLSAIHVLDRTGEQVEAGRFEGVRAAALQVRVPLVDLPNGVYTVSWRVVSTVDGHLTAGAFAFGIGVSPAGAPPLPGTSEAPSTPPPSPLGVAGKWLLYGGLALLFAAPVAGLFVFDRRLPGGALALGACWLLAATGLAIVVAAEAARAGAGVGALLSSSRGTALMREAVAIAVLGAALAAALVRRSTFTLWMLGAGTATAMLAHALAGHAAAGASARWFNVSVQWVHIAAVGAWTGGLAWLFVWTRGAASEARIASVRRFSRLATFALGIVVATGLTRALDEVGSFGRLTGTDFGIALLSKTAAVLPLIGLGALNRFRFLPQFGDSGNGGEPDGDHTGRRLRALRTSVGAEVGIAAVVLAVTGVLTGLPPAAQLAAASKQQAPAVATVDGNDFAKTTRVRLTITPGTVGPNRFEIVVRDFDTGAAVEARRVALRFSLPSRPEVGAQTLELERRGAAGTWSAQGAALAIEGRWRVVVLVQKAADSLEIPLEVEPRATPQKITVNRAPGQPAIFTITLDAGRSVQGYVDPGDPGKNEVHFTFFDPSGTELPVASARMFLTPPGGETREVTVRRFGPGHFVADAELAPGRWRFRVEVQARAGDPATAAFFEDEIG